MNRLSLHDQHRHRGIHLERGAARAWKAGDALVAGQVTSHGSRRVDMSEVTHVVRPKINAGELVLTRVSKSYGALYSRKEVIQGLLVRG